MAFLKRNDVWSLILREWPELESNQRHKDFQSSALPTELSGLSEVVEHIGSDLYFARKIISLMIFIDSSI
jgi:hypothetical protein